VASTISAACWPTPRGPVRSCLAWSSTLTARWPGSTVTRRHWLEVETKQLGGSLARATALTEQELARFASETQPVLIQTLRELEAAAMALRRLGEVLERDPSLLLYGQRERALGPGEGGNR